MQIIFQSDEFNNLDLQSFYNKFRKEKFFNELRKLKMIHSDLLMLACNYQKKL